jgi:predicted phage tail protein
MHAKYFSGNSKEEETLRRKCNIKISPKEIGYKDVGWFQLKHELDK